MSGRVVDAGNARQFRRSVALIVVAAACFATAVWRLRPRRDAETRGFSGNAAELIARAGDADESAAEQAIVDLGRMGARHAAPRLVEALRDSRPRIRAAAAAALGRLAVWETLPPLLEALRDAELPVRREAHRAIVRICGIDYGFPAGGTPAEREAAIAKIRAHYAENHAGYLDWMKRQGIPVASEAP